jgi:hypothetical protein
MPQLLVSLLTAIHFSQFFNSPWIGFKLIYSIQLINLLWGWNPPVNNFYFKTTKTQPQPQPQPQPQSQHKVSLQWKQVKKSDTLIKEFVVSHKTAVKLYKLLKGNIEYLNINLNQNGVESHLEDVQFDLNKQQNSSFYGATISFKELALMESNPSQLLLHHHSEGADISNALSKQLKTCSQIISCYGAHHPVGFKHLTPGLDAPVCVNMHDLGRKEIVHTFDGWSYTTYQHNVIISLFYEND